MEEKKCILIVEDERAIVEILKFNLKREGYETLEALDGETGLLLAQTKDPDLILLDVMLPKMSGFEVLKKLRSEGFRTPILLLTAKAEVEDQITGLDLGADDYLPKPFSMDLLLARVRAMLRRREEFTPNILTCGNISLNQHSYELSGNGQSFVLPKLEYQLMEILMLNRGAYLSTEDLLVKIWGYDTEAELGTVWVYISYLRKRLSALCANVTITAKRNVGYMLEEVK